ncbi:HDIG domain-containing protein [Entomospira nematocerorum]|uniref:HDIG domain-containing protein n=1 Tax=Entomospira nematocerorum TaxID=2719987 RepID=A0A968KSS6_9SPIO|nr:HDIG domain-containing metalloprotein [Entomospira nematocera]NIZ46711.1 HDIG domain-containing protein [Entomospira nematocera]WDI33493.1 HDIG domain-containing protein [Entomospira nematocera]
MFNPKYHFFTHFMKPLIHQRFYLLSYILLQIIIITLILFFAQGRPIWHDISTRYDAFQNHALIPSYTRESTQKIRQHFDLVRQSTLQTNNPSAVLESVLANPKIQQLQLSANDIELIYTLTDKLLHEIYEIGYLHEGLSREGHLSGFVLLREKGKADTIVQARRLITKDNLHTYIQSQINHYDVPIQLLTESLVELFLQQNLLYLGIERHLVTEISPSILRQEQLGATIYIFMINILLILIIYHIYHEQVSKLHRYAPFSKRYYMLLFLTLLALVSTFFILIWVGHKSTYPPILFAPGVIFGFMITFLFGYRHGLLFALYYQGIIMIAVGFDMLSSLYLLLTLPFAIYLASIAKTRTQLFFASPWQSLVHGLVLLTISLSSATEELNIITMMIAMLIGLIVAPIALGVSPIIERVLNLPSHYRLLDLCDLNAPTLRRLQYLAPGTYTHSLNVAILAENACQRIGANGLLARVGAYYHDIGKMENPEYFVENQVKGINKHNQMRANLSAAMIRAHVRNGYDLGKEIGLPQEILDIICQHHGQSLVSFFYTRAQTELTEHEQSLNEADFRYPGPRPRTKESATVMLADSVEAASHTIKKPSQNSISKLVEDIISHKIETNELDESPLTLKDIGKIKHSLIQSLVGQYHHRIEYPEKKK